MKLKIQCDWCGKEFERNHNHIHEKNYCCRACLGKANAERFRLKSLRTCDNCGKIFEYRGNHKKRNEHFFCCLECSYEFKVKKYMHHAIGVAIQFTKSVLMLQETSIIFVIMGAISTTSILKKLVQIIK